MQDQSRVMDWGAVNAILHGKLVVTSTYPTTLLYVLILHNSVITFIRIMCVVYLYVLGAYNLLGER